MRQVPSARSGGEMKIRIAIRRIPLFAATLLTLFAGAAYATTSSPVTTTTLQSLNGVVLNITGGFTATSITLLPSTITQAATSSCTWASNGQCNTATISGNWNVYVQLQLNTVPAAATSYTVIFGDGQAIVGTNPFSPVRTISFSVPSTSTAASTMFFVFDSGSTNLVGGTFFTVAVQ
jgi:hypothetical protein